MKPQKIRMTRRQQLIGQMRVALNSLEKPNHPEDETSIIFEIAETEFEFTQEQLADKSMSFQ